MDFDHLRIKPGDKPKLDKIDTRDDFGLEKEPTKLATQAICDELGELQYDLFVEGRRSVLVVLQAMDAGGKDGTIRSVLHEMNPQGARVAAFKKPTERELAHDFLWRVHQQVPGQGELVVFNRSHYEDVLVVRVHDWISGKVCRARYERIQQFERLLVEESRTTVVKIMLHISPDEQLERFKSRLDEPRKHWKLNLGDYDERELWPKYMGAFEDAIQATSTEDAPWYVVPADRKWARNLAVATILRDTMRGMKLQPPVPAEDVEAVRARYEQAAAEAHKLG